MVAGGTVDARGQGYQYYGLGAGAGVSDQWSWMVKIIGNFLRYEYEAGGRTIKARVPGARLQTGPKYFAEGTYLIVTGGLDYRDTSLSPDDKTSPARGAKTGAVLEALYNRDLKENFALDLIGSYQSIDNFLWGRARLKYLISSMPGMQRLFIGVDGGGQGNRDFTAQQFGAMMEIQRLQEGISLTVSGGYRRSKDTSNAGYFGLDLYYRFY